MRRPLRAASAADHLNKIADRFAAASQSGSISDLKPPTGGSMHPHGHHGHGGHAHAHAGGATAQTDAVGAGPDGSLGQVIQGIISNALGETTSG